MSMRRSDTWSWMHDVLPFAALLMTTCLDMAMLTIVKAAMNDGMVSLVYVIYCNTLGTLILLPFFILHVLRKVDRPPLTTGILFRFFTLGLFGVCLFEVLMYVGVSYSSPTMVSALSNLAPGITFLIAVIFRKTIGYNDSNIRSNGVHILPRPKDFSYHRFSQPAFFVTSVGMDIWWSCNFHRWNIWLLMECFTNRNS